MPTDVVYIPKVWRSEIAALGPTILTTIAAVVLSHYFPRSVITGPLFSVGETELFMRLPMYWLIPLSVLFYAIFRMYNVRYSFDGMGIECRVGILSFRQRIVRIGFEDIRSIETDQTLLARLLDIGTLSIGTAATGEVEVRFEGIAAPKELQELIRAERDRRQKMTASGQGPTPTSQVA